jgi:hypothetical protein
VSREISASTVDHLGLGKIIRLGKMKKIRRADLLDDHAGQSGLHSLDRMRNYKMSCREIDSILFSGRERSGAAFALDKIPPLSHLHSPQHLGGLRSLRRVERIPVRSRLLEVAGRSKTEN